MQNLHTLKGFQILPFPSALRYNVGEGAVRVLKGKDWILWAAAALLIILTCVLSAAGSPDMAPVTVVYPSSETAPDDISGPTTQWQYPLPSAVTRPRPDASQAASSDETTFGPSVSRGKINLNTADKETLMTLEGVGEVIAERIIAYRKSHGGFDTVEEIMEVEGVGEKRFAAWKPYITV